MKPIVLASDARYAMPLAVTLRSLAEAHRSPEPLELHVLHPDLPASTCERIARSLPSGAATIRWVPIDVGLFQGLRSLDYISKMTFARLLIPEILPASVSRVLYLDADLLVLDDLGPLWEIDLEGAIVAAVVDELDEARKESRPGLEGMPAVARYFNAGVLVLDLPRWRDARVSERVLKYLVEHPDLPFSDQDALNAVCDGAWKPLATRWNFQKHHGFRIAELPAAERPAIVHFVTAWKPWNANARSVNADFYDDFRSRTHFARTLPERGRDAVARAWVDVKRRLRG